MCGVCKAFLKEGLSGYDTVFKGFHKKGGRGGTKGGGVPLFEWGCALEFKHCASHECKLASLDVRKLTYPYLAGERIF